MLLSGQHSTVATLKLMLMPRMVLQALALVFMLPALVPQRVLEEVWMAKAEWGSHWGKIRWPSWAWCDTMLGADKTTRFAPTTTGFESQVQQDHFFVIPLCAKSAVYGLHSTLNTMNTFFFMCLS